MIEIGPLLFAASAVGILHMSAPDHWLTLVIIGRVLGWRRSQLVAVSLITGLGHVLLSVLLGLGIVALGLVFSQLVSHYVTLAVALAMIVAGSAYTLISIAGRTDTSAEKEAEEELLRTQNRSRRGVSYFAVLGAALSPDLSILPIFLAAVPVGLVFAAYAAVIFGAASLLTIVFLTYVGSAGLASALERVPSKYNDALVGLVIAAVGGYILVFG